MSHPNSIYADSALFRGGSPAITQVGSPAFSAGRNPSLHSVAVNLHQLPLTPVPPRKALADVCSVFVSAGGDARQCCGRAATELCADVAVVSDWTPLGLSPAGPRSLSELAGPCGPTINIFVPNSFPTEPRAVQLTVCIGPLRIQLRSPRGCSHSHPRLPAGLRRSRSCCRPRRATGSHAQSLPAAQPSAASSSLQNCAQTRRTVS